MQHYIQHYVVLSDSTRWLNNIMQHVHNLNWMQSSQNFMARSKWAIIMCTPLPIQ